VGTKPDPQAPDVICADAGAGRMVDSATSATPQTTVFT
jgi:hypothetical protein